MLADAYFPLRYLIAVRLLHMKRKILPEFSISTPLYYMENWSLDDFLLQLVNEYIYHAVYNISNYGCMYHIFLNKKQTKKLYNK